MSNGTPPTAMKLETPQSTLPRVNRKVEAKRLSLRPYKSLSLPMSGCVAAVAMR